MSNLIYYPFLQTRLSAQLLSVDTKMKILNPETLCADLTGGDYTYLDISDGVNLEVVKATGCDGNNCIIIERDILGTGAYSFGIDSCVSFSNKMPTIKDIICDLLENAESECGSINWICNITGDDFIDVAPDPTNSCGKVLTFNPGTTEEYKLCIEPDLEVDLDNAHKVAVCVNGEVYLTTLQDICAFIIEKLGPDIEYVEDILPGAGIDVNTVGSSSTVSLKSTLPGSTTLTGGAEVNQFGQFTSIPSGWPFGTAATLSNGLFQNASITVAGGVITNVTAGSVVAGVVQVNPGTGIGVSGTSSNPTVYIKDTGVSSGTHGQFVVNAQGQITQVLSGFNSYKNITALPPLAANTVVDDREITHINSGIIAGTYCGIVFDEKGHATSAINAMNHIQWVGSANPFGETRTSGMFATDVGSGILDFTFDNPIAGATYQTDITADTNGITYTVSAKSINGFRVDFGAQTNIFYITVTFIV